MAGEDVKYTVVAQGDDRAFEIMVGLREGYGDGRHEPEHTPTEVIEAHHDWQRERNCVLGVFVTTGRLSYGWPEDGRMRGADEPACAVSGNINVLYDRDMKTADAHQRVNDLAIYLARRFGQTRIYVRFDGLSTILHCEGAETPTGD